jgi:hypothetical protein
MVKCPEFFENEARCEDKMNAGYLFDKSQAPPFKSVKYHDWRENENFVDLPQVSGYVLEFQACPEIYPEKVIL